METASYGPPSSVEWRELNGFPAIVVENEHHHQRLARRFVVRGDLDAEGRVSELHIVLASEKLGAVTGAAS